MIILAVYTGLAVLLIVIIPKDTPAPLIALISILLPYLVIWTCLALVKISSRNNSTSKKAKESWGRFAFFIAVIVFSLLVILF